MDKLNLMLSLFGIQSEHGQTTELPSHLESRGLKGKNIFQGPLTFSILDGSSGLCSPRKVSVHENDIFVAESGVGAVSDPENPEVANNCYYAPQFFSYTCIGSTAQVSKISTDGMKTVVLDNLFSNRPLSGQGETHATGAQSVTFHNGDMYTVIGLGLNGTLLANDGIYEEYGAFGSILKGSEVAADPWVAEYKYNYDGSTNPSGVLAVPDSNPYHLLILNDTYYVADAGGNTLLTYEALNNVSLTEPVSAMVIPRFTGITAAGPPLCEGITPPYGPPFCGTYQEDGVWKYDTESVPTAIRARPEHPDKIYVSTLVGAIWNEPVATIYEIQLDKNGIPIDQTPITNMFYGIIDFGFYDENTIYVLEAPLSPYMPFVGGRLTRVNLKDGTRSIVAGDETLTNPSGVLIDGDKIYVTNNTFNLNGVDANCDGHILVATVE